MATEVNDHHHDNNGNLTGLIFAAIVIILFLIILLFGNNAFRGMGTQSQPAPQQAESESQGGESGQSESFNVEVPDQIDVNLETSQHDDE